jgi:hypothetical protein
MSDSESGGRSFGRAALRACIRRPASQNPAMPTVVFTSHLRRQVPAGSVRGEGATLRAVLDNVCRQHPAVRGYLFDDQARLRRHVNIFVDGSRVTCRDSLDRAVAGDAELFVMQALTGG